MPQLRQTRTVGRNTSTRCDRSASGSTIVLILVCCLAVLLLVALFALNYARILGGSQEQHTAIEAASLAAASDLSRIVIQDQNYGYVSLTDYPPYGGSTVAADGQSLPVLGINTIVGTARLDMLLANALNDATMIQLAQQDAKNARDAERNLNNVLDQAINPGSTPQATDINGNQVTPYEDAKAVFDSNYVKMANGGQSSNFGLKLGWLKSGSSTITALPQPSEQADVPAGSQQSGAYKSFLNIPAGGETFYFVGVGSQSALVDNSQFVSDQVDNSVPSSVVKAVVDQQIIRGDSSGKQDVDTVHAEACAQPPAINDNGPPGSICISFPSGNPPGINTVGDLSNNPQLKTNHSQLFTPPDNDWPSDPNDGTEGTLVPTQFKGTDPPVAQVWSMGLYHFIRNARTRPRIDEVVKLQSTSFSSLGGPGTMTPITVSMGFVPPAYADSSSQSPPVQTGVLSTPVGTPNDTRIAALKNDTPQGRTAYWSAAGYSSVQSILPASALMVGLDQEGNVVSTDGSPLNREAIQSFWKTLTDTNAAALTCVSIAGQVAQTAQGQVGSTNQQIAQLQSQVDNLTNQLQSQTLSSDQQLQLKQQISALNDQIGQLSNTLQAATLSVSNAQAALKNGTAVASVTHTICRNQRTLTARGLAAAGGTYKLAGNIFVPHPIAPANAAAIANGQAPSGDANATSWTAQNFPCYDLPTGIAARMGKQRSIFPAAQAQSVVPPALAAMYLLEFRADGHLEATVFPASPFMSVPVSQKQWLAVCYSALQSGDSSAPVSWAMLMRDQTVALGPQNGGKHAGQPIGGAPFDWCQQITFGSKRSKQNKWSKSKKNNGTKGGMNFQPDGLLTPFAQPAYAGNGNSGQGGPGNSANAPGHNKGNPRVTYTCGGLATEFQIRSPIVGNCASLQPATTKPPPGGDNTPVSVCPPSPDSLL